MSARILLQAVLPFLLAVVTAFPANAEPVRASRGTIALPTYPWAAVKHPYFRGTDGVNIYPYPMLDFLSREKTNRTYQTVLLENEFLRITILPELGGRIHEVLDKTTGEPMFYVNHVIKPGLIGQCGAWISGGVEWNTGPQGHTVSCLQPMSVLILPREKDGSQSVAIGETERIYHTKWTVVVTLRPGRSFIEERIRIYNPTETIRPYYFWNCTAVPNTPGFRFIYPMTLGMDHSGDKFFQWPIDNGRDLTRGTNYQDASSIFAYNCDQDFFGSYNDDLDRGVVSYANHHQVPGKKAWTWGHGSYGTMHQKDLTDSDGPYNEVQTGPLLTQGEVGRLDPCEAVEWQEWWYPIHGLGGFTFANKDVAILADRKGTNLTLRLMGSAVWKGVEVRLWDVDRVSRPLARFDLSPRSAAVVDLRVPEDFAKGKCSIELRHRGERLALFPLPLDLPKREVPTKKPAPQTATELAQAGWQDFLFARQSEAESHFRKALEADPKSSLARIGLAFLRLDSAPEAAMKEAMAATEITPGTGLAHYVLAVAADRSKDNVTALDEAWKATLDPATAVAGRALVAKLEIRSAGYRAAADALAQPGPWKTDPLCRNRLAFALLEMGDRARAVNLTRQNLAVDPLDPFALCILWLARAETKDVTLRKALQADPRSLLDLVADFSESGLRDQQASLRLLREFGNRQDVFNDAGSYWSLNLLGLGEQRGRAQTRAISLFPSSLTTLSAYQKELDRDPKDGHAALYLGHLLFHLGRYAEGREMWKRAAELGAEPVIACRALGMAAKTLDSDLKTARTWLEKANQADPKDSIVARDLVNVLFALADKADTDAAKRELVVEARDRLKGAFAEGRGRSDYAALLARSYNRLGDFAETARMLDSVRVTIWEGTHEAHDLFEQAHLALGDAQLAAGHPAEALAEFDRALTYPENLATGRLETTCDAHIYFRRGQALAALGRKDEARAAWQLAVDALASNDPTREDARRQARAALQS
jgi:tetratricopeptide (TPR) repeat protein